MMFLAIAFDLTVLSLLQSQQPLSVLSESGPSHFVALLYVMLEPCSLAGEHRDAESVDVAPH